MKKQPGTGWTILAWTHSRRNENNPEVPVPTFGRLDYSIKTTPASQTPVVWWLGGGGVGGLFEGVVMLRGVVAQAGGVGCVGWRAVAGGELHCGGALLLAEAALCYLLGSEKCW
jgi:hypothetical protein